MIELFHTTAAISAPLLVSAIYSIGLLFLGLCCLNVVGLSRKNWHSVPLGVFLGTAFALGSGLAATLWVLLSFVGLFRAPEVLGTLIAVIPLGMILNRAVGRETVVALKHLVVELRAESVAWQLIALALAVLLIDHGLSTLHPAIGDSVAFYLPWARVIADTGQVMRLPGYEQFSDLWTVAEIQTAAIMMFANDFAAKALPFWHAVFAAVLLWGTAGAARLGLRGRLLIVAMLFTSSAVTMVTWDGKIDLVALPIGLAVLIVAALKDPAHARAQGLVVGLLAGAAVAAKLSYLPVLGIGILIISAWRIWEGVRLGKQGWAAAAVEEAQWLLIVAAAGALILLPQMLRNWIMSGEPFAPLYYFKGARFDIEQNWFTAATTRRILLTYPFALTFGVYWGQYGDVSLLAWAFFPLCLVFAKNQSRVFWLLSAAAVAGIVGWALLKTSTFAPRYILCSLILYLIFIAGIAERASRSGPPLVRLLVVAMTAYTICTSVAGFAPILPTAVSYALSGDIENNQDNDSFAIARMLNATAPAGTRIALVNWYRYPLRADLLECAIGGTEFPAGPSPDMRDYFVRGVRYIVFDPSHKSARDQIMGAIPSWLQVKQIYAGAELTAFEMVPMDGAPKVDFGCKRIGGVWQRTPID